MPPSVDPKVLAVADRVLARNCSVVTAIEEEFVAFVDSKSEEAFHRSVCRRAATPRRVRRRLGRPSITPRLPRKYPW